MGQAPRGRYRGDRLLALNSGQLGVLQVSVDSEGSPCVAEVFNGRVQKFRPKPGAGPAMLILERGSPVCLDSFSGTLSEISAG
jgi:hypothetical protein